MRNNSRATKVHFYVGKLGGLCRTSHGKVFHSSANHAEVTCRRCLHLLRERGELKEEQLTLF
jgi:hypothetical protein